MALEQPQITPLVRARLGPADGADGLPFRETPLRQAGDQAEEKREVIERAAFRAGQIRPGAQGPRDPRRGRAADRRRSPRNSLAIFPTTASPRFRTWKRSHSLEPPPATSRAGCSPPGDGEARGRRWARSRRIFASSFADDPPAPSVRRAKPRASGRTSTRPTRSPPRSRVRSDTGRSRRSGCRGPAGRGAGSARRSRPIPPRETCSRR